MLDKISQALDDLSGAERKVAECALAEPKWFVHAAVAEIAERATVSQPTVIRFCRTLGYKGLPEFKLALSAGLGSEGMPFVHEELNADDDMGGVMAKVLGNTAAALLGARRFLHEAELENAIAMLTHARRIEFYGVGNSGIVAQDAQHKFFRFGMSTVAYSDPHIQLMAASVLSDQDVVVVVSNSGASIELLDAVSTAKENGAAVIAITRMGLAAGASGRLRVKRVFARRQRPIHPHGFPPAATGRHRHFGHRPRTAAGRNRQPATGKRQTQPAQAACRNQRINGTGRLKTPEPPTLKEHHETPVRTARMAATVAAL